jgi:protein-S-isoprenylcysteine O-methyltransferase Ste14
MIAQSVPYDLVFLVHVLSAVAVVAVFVVMRVSASAIVRGANDEEQRRRFPDRRNWAARVLHLMVITGLTMSLIGDTSVSLTKPWIGVGLLCYLAAAGHLEARTLPLERTVAEVIAHDGHASVERGRQLVRSMDTLLAIIAVALVAMVVQF